MARALMTASVGLLLGATWGVGGHDGMEAMKAQAREGKPEPLCRSVCEHIHDCRAGTRTESVADCVKGCIDDETAWTDACRNATVVSMACHNALSCETLRPLYDAEVETPGEACEAERQAVRDCQPATEEFIYFQF